MTTAGTPAVELRHVSKRFGDHLVLDDLSLVVAAGRAICVLGRSGTGKSVMLKHVIGLMRPDEGSVLVEGHDVTRLSPRELARVRQRMGMLFQHAALFDSISVGENVAFPMRRHSTLPPREIRERAEALLADVGLSGEYEKMPADLSGGMRKRAGLARALALEPAILLADEPSTGLDPVTSREIDRLLVELRDRTGATLIVVTHDIPSARVIGDELVFLHEGRIVAQGTAAALDQSDIPLVRQFMQADGARLDERRRP